MILIEYAVGEKEDNMKRMILIIAMTMMFAFANMGIARAETDKRARILINKLEAQVETLENKVTSLQLLVQKLQADNEKLQGKVDSNFALIKALATRLNQNGP
ncbi:hypothetical protein [Desulfovibrio ferrophilus]|uniref:DUF16 family-like protein n=1 Tax=Desulfovibrio ferrophilus TaxID=241368 RepID=A0A2Z6AWC7_9BACT|nr:hypothetical protein [Desulfovibrio ferrophilus]BBD07531.1 DUF16 family-like protein [Desulfovibrio ferrophilus]